MNDDMPPIFPGESRDEYRERILFGRDNEAAIAAGVGPLVPDPTPLPWWRRFLNRTFRKWAYGVSVAAVGVLAAVLERPEIIPLAAPLILALFYVDSNGDGK